MKAAREQVTVEAIEKWSSQLQVRDFDEIFWKAKKLFVLTWKKNHPTLNTIRHVIRAFGFAVQSAYGGDEGTSEHVEKNKRKKQNKRGAIDDPECKSNRLNKKESFHQHCLSFGVSAFNGIVRICLKQLLPAICRFLRLKIVKTTKLKPESSQHWKYIENIMKKYLTNFTRVRWFEYGMSYTKDLLFS